MMLGYSKEQQTRRKGKKAKVNGYAEATERARTGHGYLVCEICGRSLLDGQEQRHHIKHRSQGGENSADNLKVTCPECHLKAHNIQSGTKDR